MAQRYRGDCPRSWHHVMNRGIARRTAFETRSDIRAFLAAFACEVRRGEIELHAYCVMTTHYHLLIRSLQGRMGAAMRRAVNRYVRRFNRLRRRDGSLFRGRYRSRPILTQRYREAVVRYIEHNPVAAGIVSAADRYPFSSAASHATAHRPGWLAGWWIDAALDRGRAQRCVAYDARFGVPSGALVRLVEGRMHRPAAAVDPLDDLVKATSRGVSSWMVRKAELADHTRPGIELADSVTILAMTSVPLTVGGSERIRVGTRHARPVADIVRIALLRDLGGLKHVEVAQRIGRTPAHCKRLYSQHALLMQRDAGYATVVGDLVRRVLDASHGK